MIYVIKLNTDNPNEKRVQHITDYGANAQEVVVGRAEVFRVAIRAKSPEEQHDENQDLKAKIIILTILSFLRKAPQIKYKNGHSNMD